MLSLSFVRMVVCVFMCCEGLVKTDTVEDGYSGEVKTYLDDLKENEMQYELPVDKAYEKMEEFSNEFFDNQYAIALINLYTQATDFYVTLNREMRSGNATEKWRIAGDLINRGLDILGTTLYNVTYRGCTTLDVLPMKGSEYRFNQITSTSLNKTIAIDFGAGCGRFLFIIHDVYGVLINRYSAFSSENEVLLKSTEVFDVTDGPVTEDSNIIYYLDGRGKDATLSGCDKAVIVNMKTISVLVVLFLLFH